MIHSPAPFYLKFSRLKQKDTEGNLLSFSIFRKCRGGEIRTRDPLLPKRAKDIVSYCFIFIYNIY